MQSIIKDLNEGRPIEENQERIEEILTGRDYKLKEEFLVYFNRYLEENQKSNLAIEEDIYKILEKEMFRDNPFHIKNYIMMILTTYCQYHLNYLEKNFHKLEVEFQEDIQYIFNYDRIKTKKMAERLNFRFSEQNRDVFLEKLYEELENDGDMNYEVIRFLIGYLYIIGNKEDIQRIRSIIKRVDLRGDNEIYMELEDILRSNHSSKELERLNKEFKRDFIVYYSNYKV